MRVCFDLAPARFISGGIAVYIKQLRQALTEVDPQLEMIDIDIEPPQLRGDRGLVRPIRALYWDTLHTHVLLPWNASRGGADLIHMTGIRVPLRSRVPVVTTIYDVAPFIYPRTFRYRDAVLLSLYLRLSSHTAHHIITISEQSRRDISAVLDLPLDRVITTHVAAAPHFVPASTDQQRQMRARLGIQGPYMLSVGNIEPRKNLRRVLEAYARLQQIERIPHRLVLVGRAGPLAEPIMRLTTDLGIAEHVQFTGFVSDADLQALYSGASLFVYPSLYEGFGIPPLEAMACECPVVSSNRSSLPEVVGDAALLVDPFQTDELVEAMGLLLTDRELADEFRQRGQRQAARFSWQRCARETIAAYRQVLTG